MPKYLVSYQQGYSKKGKPLIRTKTVEADNRLKAINKVKGGFTAVRFKSMREPGRRFRQTKHRGIFK